MLECLMMGDSIAVGIGQNRPECVTIAKVGITSDKWYKQYSHRIDQPFKIVVISLGTNDWKTTYTAEYLYDIRKKVKANAVVWILPSLTLKPTQRAIVREIASEFKDKTMDISQFIGPDGIHPTGRGYQTIARSLKNE
jgi:lysophospholipase L1-like esterase